MENSNKENNINENKMQSEKIGENKEKRGKLNIARRILLYILAIIVVAIIAFVIYEVATVNNTYYIGEKNLQIPILVYHDIVADESQVEFDYMQTPVKQFEKQMTGLMKLGYKPISYKDLVEYKNGNKAIPKWSFLVTFDDGYTGVYDYAFEIAKKYNIPMTSFEITDTVGIPGYYTWEQAREMNESGLMSIYLHGYTHTEYDKVAPEELLAQTNMAQEDLQNNLKDSNILKVFTYPYGLYNDEGRAVLAQAGYVQNLTDNKINTSKELDLSGLHRSYALEDSPLKLFLKIQYRNIRY